MEILSAVVYSSAMKGKTLHIAGRGVNGLGALVSYAGSKDGTSSATNIILEADALVCNNSNNDNAFYFICSGYKIDFKGNTLHLGGSNRVTLYGGAAMSNMTRPGRAIVCEGAKGAVFTSSSNSSMWNFWHSDCEIAVTNSSHLTFSRMHVSTFNWPVTLYEGAVLQVAQTPNGWSPTTGYNRITKSSVVTLLDPVRNRIQLTNAGDHLFISGEIRGGGMTVETYTPGAGLYLENRNNNFTNGVAVGAGCSVHVVTNGALPAAGAPLVLSDRSGAVLHSLEPYVLPPLEASGNCYVSNYVGVSSTGAWSGYVRKSGAGTLRYNVLVGSPLLDLRGGTVKFEPVGGKLPVFGAIGGIAAGTADFGGSAYSVDSASGSPNVVNCPTLTVTSGWTCDATASVDSEGLSTDGVLAFAEGCTLAVQNASAIAAGSRKRTWVVATAAGGIEGIPDCAGDVPGWTLEKTLDSKTLLLHSPSIGFRMILR
jgi:hypothetical protein